MAQNAMAERQICFSDFTKKYPQLPQVLQAKTQMSHTRLSHVTSVTDEGNRHHNGASVAIQ